jgi:carbon-monoxide dehydrogenase medium subunit
MISDYTYYRPETIGQAFEIASKLPPESYNYIAGGTDLMPGIQHGLKNPSHVIDVKRIPELQRLEDDENGLFIGGAVTINEYLEHSEIASKYPPLAEAISQLASYQIRNRATFVGNVCNASPCANAITPFCVLEAVMVIFDGSDLKEIPVNDFVQGVKRTALKPYELVVGIRIPALSKDARGGFLEKTRVKGPDIGSANVACLVIRSQNVLRISLGSLNQVPVTLELGELFSDKKLSYEQKLEKAKTQVESGIKPITDIRSTSEYRMNIAKVFTERLIRKLWKEVE